MKRLDCRSSLFWSWSGPVAVFFQSWDRTFKHYLLQLVIHEFNSLLKWSLLFCLLHTPHSSIETLPLAWDFSDSISSTKKSLNITFNPACLFRNCLDGCCIGMSIGCVCHLGVPSHLCQINKNRWPPTKFSTSPYQEQNITKMASISALLVP